MTRKLLYVIPRVEIASKVYGQAQVTLGKATFLPDNDSTWRDRIAKPRPQCLDIFRDFPPGGTSSSPPVSKGTVVISDDESWLHDNIAYVVAAAYALGTQENWWNYPAEAFQFFDLSVGDVTHDLVRFHTKTGSLTEDVGNFQLLPPLELRGARGQFRIDTRSTEFAELDKRLKQQLPDRLTVASYHLFRTQFANGFLASARQDYAAYCACLEAAFDTPKSRDGGDTLATAVETFYAGYKGLRQFIEGLYEERSVFNHGVSEAGLEPHRQKLLEGFRALPFRWDLLRHVCIDVVLEKAREAAGQPRGDIGTFFSQAFAKIESCFSSKSAWEELCGELTKKGSVKTMLGLHEAASASAEQDDARLSAFIGLCCRFLMIHNWSSKDIGTEAKKACSSLRCLAEIIHATSQQEDVKAAATELHEAAKAGDKVRLDKWATQHASWTMLRGYESLTEAAQAVAAHIARLFDSY